MTKKKTAKAPDTDVCDVCKGHPEGACSRCDGEGVDPEVSGCSCDCCGGTGACDACGGTGKAT